MNRHVISNSLDIIHQAQISLDGLMLLLGDAHDGQLQKIGALLRSVTKDLEHGLSGIEAEIYPESNRQSSFYKTNEGEINVSL